ncbi:MAG: hypothetical protein ABI623_06350, partial [bacterium]
MNRFLQLLSIVIFAHSAFAANDLYVAINGNDSSPGSKAKPFATFNRAREAARITLHKQGRKTGVTVWIKAGVYRLTQTFRLDSLDSETTYRSMPDEDVRITGGTLLSTSAFKPVTDQNILRGLTEEAGRHVVHAQLKSFGVSDFGEMKQIGFSLPVIPAPLELFFNDRPMQLARYPNRGEIAIGTVVDAGSVPRVGNFSNRGGTFVYSDPHHARWAGLDDVWLSGTFMWGYAEDVIHVESIDTIAQRIKLSSPHIYGIGTGEPFRQYIALNILDELDDPGEYYLDRKNGIIYFWPPAPLNGSTIAVSGLEHPLISLEGASNVTLQGLTIEYGRGI